MSFDVEESVEGGGDVDGWSRDNQGKPRSRVTRDLIQLLEAELLKVPCTFAPPPHVFPRPRLTLNHGSYSTSTVPYVR